LEQLSKFSVTTQKESSSVLLTKRSKSGIKHYRTNAGASVLRGRSEIEEITFLDSREDRLMKTKIMAIILLGFLIMLPASSGWAKDEYPSKPIQFICPYAVGGITDLAARVVAEYMGKYLGQPLIVVNKPGAASALGTAFVAASKPDGYTLLTNWVTIVTVPLVTPDLPYKLSDLAPIGRTVTADQIFLVNKDLPVKTLPELVAYAKQHPKTLSYGTVGVGSLPHLVMEQFNTQMQVDIQHIPYNSELQSVTALVGNHVQVSVLTYASSGPHIRSGAIRPLAILAPKRDPRLPQVPTSAEQGNPELLASIYNVLMAPARTPAPIMKKLEDALEKTVQDKEAREKMEKLDYRVNYLNSRDTKAFLDAETKKWSEVVKKANIVVK
jgi:tripartite-type tricarboxylate transporter receptor subunit TctC